MQQSPIARMINTGDVYGIKTPMFAALPYSVGISISSVSRHDARAMNHQPCAEKHLLHAGYAVS
jgi:hypothetical protein